MTIIRFTRNGHFTALLAAAVLFAAAPAALARYARPQLEEVPIERLAGNLAERLEKKPGDAPARLNLARLYAMSYALKTDTTEAIAGKPEQGAWFGFEPKNVPFEVRETDDPAKQKAAQAQLEKAITQYKLLIEAHPKNLTGQLGYAWCLQQAGKEMQAIEQYRKTIELGWEAEKDKEFAGPGWHSIVAEAASYLIPLLNEKSNKEEIATINRRIEHLSRLPRAVTPIAVPLKSRLSVRQLEDKTASVAFDADGSGEAKRWTWITPDAAWLVSDPRDKRRVTSGLQLFGNVTWWLFWDNGYQALAALDDNADGELMGGELDGLALWHDADVDGECDEGEVKPLAEWGVVALSCRWETLAENESDIAWSPAGVRFADGEMRPTYDLVLDQAK